MNKVILVAMFLWIGSASASDNCGEWYKQIQRGQNIIDQLAYELKLQALDINSYNPSQRQAAEYIERAVTYSSLSENYNAIVSNHNIFVKQYKGVCE